MKSWARTTPAFFAAAFLFSGNQVGAHGFAGDRFFPATIATDDPFVADELSLPTVSTFRNPQDEGNPATQETDVSIDISKRITQNFGIGFGESWQHLDPKGSAPVSGLGNLDLNAKYLLLESDPHEFLFSVGVDAEVGGTGSRRIGADPSSTVTPAVFFGKGMGDLPQNLKFLKPIAITGSLGFSSTTASSGLHAAVTGLAIEYSLPYLQSSVQNVGLGAPLNHIIPLVEFSFSTPLNGDGSRETTGTINPGFIWAGQKFQIGVEAIVPVNSQSGRDVGATAQLHFFLDDIFPHTIGKPLIN